MAAKDFELDGNIQAALGRGVVTQPMLEASGAMAALSRAFERGDYTSFAVMVVEKGGQPKLTTYLDPRFYKRDLNALGNTAVNLAERLQETFEATRNKKVGATLE
jgi:hypothetical protein